MPNMETAKTPKTTVGVVTSNSGAKSLRVTMDYKVRHPKYNKFIRHRMKLAVHDEKNECGVGDRVEIAECRPYSKTKSWRVVRVLEKAARV